jgi:excisionase family DNA binding protein
MPDRKIELKQAWSPAEYAERYGVCRATVYNWLKAGMLESKKIGGARRILKEHDDEFRARLA